MNTAAEYLVQRFRTWHALLQGLAFVFVGTAAAQNTVPTLPPIQLRSSLMSIDQATDELTQSDRIQFALEIALTAAKADMPELSLEAVKRAAKHQWVATVPQFQSSVLGGGSQTSPLRTATTLRIVNGVTVPVTMTGVQRSNARVSKEFSFATRVLEIVDVWKIKRVPSDKIAAALKPAILVPGNINALNLHQELATRSSQTQFPSLTSNVSFQLARSVAWEFMQAAVPGGQDTALVEELQTRAALPEAALNASALQIMHIRLKDGFPAAVDQLTNNRSDSTLSSPSARETLLSALLSVSEPSNMEVEQLPHDALMQLGRFFQNSSSLRTVVAIRLRQAVFRGDIDQVKRELELVDCVVRNGDKSNTEYYSRIRQQVLKEAAALATEHKHPQLVEFLNSQMP